MSLVYYFKIECWQIIDSEIYICVIIRNNLTISKFNRITSHYLF